MPPFFIFGGLVVCAALSATKILAQALYLCPRVASCKQATFIRTGYGWLVLGGTRFRAACVTADDAVVFCFCPFVLCGDAVAIH